MKHFAEDLESDKITNRTSIIATMAVEAIRMNLNITQVEDFRRRL